MILNKKAWKYLLNIGKKRLNWAFLMHEFAKIFIDDKYRLKTEHFFLLKLDFNKRGFSQNIDNFWL